MKNFRIFHLKTFIFSVVKFSVYLNRLVPVMVYLADVYIVSLGLGIREMEPNTLNQHCSAKLEKSVKVSNSQWQWAGCVMANICMNFH